MNAVELTDRLKDEARRLGFTLAGACPAVTPTGFARLREWLEAGFAGEMQYLPERESAYAHPQHVLNGVRSLLMLGMPYRTVEPAESKSGYGKISRYAWGAADYHDVIHGRLRKLIEHLRRLAPNAIARGVVDTAPLLERDFARLAGLGWIGKHTLLINKHGGSWFFLAALLTDQVLEYDDPHEADHCGTCRACLDACPTDAFPQPYVLDATRCISYLTIELRGDVPAELRGGIGDWLFGCDVCQDVCPWNRRSPSADESAFQPRTDLYPVELTTLFELTDDDFRERFRRSPLWRSKRRGILRNAAIVLGNQRQREFVPPLARGLNDAEPLVRAASAWALGQIGDPAARAALADRLHNETDPSVREGIAAAVQASK